MSRARIPQRAPRRRAGRAALALLLALAACGPGVPGAPRGGGADGSDGPQGGGPETYRLGPTAFDGRRERLPLTRWAPEGPPRAIILALHGFGDHGASTFASAGPAWAARGIETIAYDQRAFGRNPDWQVWPGADQLISDAAATLAALRAARPGVPVFVLGHSMGGGVTLAAAGEGRLDAAAGLVLLAPAVWGGDSLPLAYRAGAWTMAQVAPSKRWTGEGMVRIYPSDNIEMLRALARDPLVYGAPSSREFLGLIRLMDRAVAAAGQVTLPVLLVEGAHDEVVPGASLARVRDLMPGDPDHVVAERGWHMLLRDLHADEVHALVADWVLAEAAAAPEG